MRGCVKEMAKNNQRFKEYHIGLDVGTNSVGWAVTDNQYRVLKFNRKSMKGVRRFNEAKTAESTRLSRTDRRRLERREDRLDFLKNVFQKSIETIDPNFFVRMNESAYYPEDKSIDTKYSLFDDNNYTDIEYHQDYPTIYHLRKELIDNPDVHDPRLVYLALHHILKYRGHFLFEGDLQKDSNFIDLLTTFDDWVYNIFEINMFNFNSLDVSEFEKTLKDRELTGSDKQKYIYSVINTEVDKDQKKIFKQLSQLIAGLKITDITMIFTDKEIEGTSSLEIAKDDFEEKLEGMSILSEEEKELIYKGKALYDWSILEEILNGEDSISYAKVATYEEHERDLTLLKQVIKNIGQKEYKKMFNSTQEVKNYVAYIGQSEKKKNKSTATVDEFYDQVKKVLEKAPKSDEKQVILNKIDTGTFMPKQRISSNGVIPHQIHGWELSNILNNAEHYLLFLRDTDETGLSNSQKIEEMFKFRIPYYVGPVNDAHKDEDGYAWVVRKESGKVYPWNFNQKIDVKASAEEFILRMTKKCTYVFEEPVLPKHSTLYQKFTVLNEINKIKIDGISIPVTWKQELYKELFIQNKTTITKKRLIEWLKIKGYIAQEAAPVISGVDLPLKSKLSTLQDMKDIFGEEIPSMHVVDDIVRYITLFSNDKGMLVEKLTDEFEQLTDDQIHKLKTKNYTGWGRLSRQFLEEISDTSQFKEPLSIIQALYSTNYNLMELLSDKFTFSEQIKSINAKNIPSINKLTYDLVDDLYVSPSVKRAIWQTLRLIDEITFIAKRDPSKIHIEMARGNEGGGRTTSRKDRLIDLYKDIKDDQILKKGLLEQLENEDEARLKSKKLYLYYTQMGKCMYSGEDIELSHLYDRNLYDIDHIYPRSKTKDDSFNNLVLVKRTLNDKKSDSYPLYDRLNINNQTKALWKMLEKKDLITKIKYTRLKRQEPLTDVELSSFIERQIVETRQSTKSIALILKQLYPQTDIVFVKSRHVSELRQYLSQVYNDRSFYKVRMMNDHHHAKDAYLNIVAGNVYHTKFTTNPMNYLNNSTHRGYNLAKMYDRDVKRNGKTAWIAGEDGSIKVVAKEFKKDNILTTWLQTDGKGELFDQTLMKKGHGQVPIKKGMDIDKYGGYNKPTIAYHAIVEHTNRKKREQWIVSIPVYIANQIHSEEDLKEFLMTTHDPQLKEVEILISHIHASNQLIAFDGKKARITGKSEKRYVLRNEIQPIFSDEFKVRLKEIEKLKIQDNLDEESIDINLVHEDLLSMYQEINQKIQLPIYREKNNSFIELVEDGYSFFEQLTLLEQIELVIELLKLVKSTRESSDLRKINGSKQSGVYTQGRNISNCEYFKLIHQSITGLFENEVDVIER